MGTSEHAARLTATMSSRKLLVKGFIERFFAEHGIGPSLSEIANGVGTNTIRVHAAIRQLVRDGLLHKQPGVPRGVRPIGAAEKAIEQLRAEGWTINDEERAALPPDAPIIDFTPETGLIVTKARLPRARASRHDAGGQRRKAGQEAEHGGEEESGRDGDSADGHSKH